MSYCPYTTVRGRRVAVPTAEQWAVRKTRGYNVSL